MTAGLPEPRAAAAGEACAPAGSAVSVAVAVSDGSVSSGAHDCGETSRLVLTGNEHHKRLALMVSFLLGLAVMLLPTSRSKAESRDAATTQKSFASPQAAGKALLDAAKSGDQNELLSIFGPGGRDLIFSGDAVKDRNAAQAFVSAYERMNRWDKNKDGEEILYIGADNFAFPIPLRQNGSGQWAFDTGAGRDEVLARRIGDGELTAIGVLTEIVKAQHEYFRQYHQFAQKFVSDEGQHNGLYWPVIQGQSPSPLGGLADVAKTLGYSRSDEPQPFDGYYYRILTRQRNSSKDGIDNYLENGKLTGGFAVVAWPARYRDSGIMTFVVSRDGVIREKDLGEQTPEAPAAITAYDPRWSVVLAPESANASAGSPATRE
jgi:hypothetical protein